ncbi:MAG: response regulator [Gammaproteobacteria bacterium]|nr:response regulator [Gammaproteobacteria bacterium]
MKRPDTKPIVLVVDDDETFCRIMDRALSRRQFTCFTARNGKDALTLAQKHQPSHCVLDLRIGAELGTDLIQSLKTTAQNIKILMLTGYASIATTVHAIKIGADNYIAKPATVDTILNALGLAAKNPEAVADGPRELMSVKRLEWEHIQRVLSENDGNISATARALGMHRRTLQRKLGKRPVKH